MKKIFKSKIIQNSLFFILGAVIFGGIGVVATTYVLESSEIKYKNNKSVQQAIEELYTLAENGSNETLTIGDVTVLGTQITILYTGDYPTIRCVYGTDENYGNVGAISNNTCYFYGTTTNQKLYYKIVATDNTGKVYEYIGNATTGEKDTLVNKTYTTGNAITLGGYNWHVIGDTGTNLTLLMDANQLGSYSNMQHCTDDTNPSTDCGYNFVYIYSWDKSKIRTYLNSTFLSDLESKITNEIVSTFICTDSSRRDETTTYGGYLGRELSGLGKQSSCYNNVRDKVRLMSYSEYWNMSPYYSGINRNYPNVENITRLSTSSDYESWLYNSSIGSWWIMGSYTGSNVDDMQRARAVYRDGLLGGTYGESYLGVRPVITIVK